MTRQGGAIYNTAAIIGTLFLAPGLTYDARVTNSSSIILTPSVTEGLPSSPSSHLWKDDPSPPFALLWIASLAFTIALLWKSNRHLEPTLTLTPSETVTSSPQGRELADPLSREDRRLEDWELLLLLCR